MQPCSKTRREIIAVPVDPDECKIKHLSSFKSCHEASKRYGGACDLIKSAIEGTCLQDIEGSNFCKLLAIDRRTSAYRSALTSTCWSRPRFRIAGLRGEIKIVCEQEQEKCQRSDHFEQLTANQPFFLIFNIPSIRI